MKKVLITGTAGFIGFHLAKLLLDEGFKVHGYDGMTDYYDVSLKQERNKILLENSNFTSTVGMLEDNEKLDDVANKFQPDVIVHLAAQAGVRYSLENPRTYINSNIVGTFNVMEVARKQKVKHLLMASTSSVYGANSKMPFTEIEKADTQLTIYAATKKANESLAHSYSHLWKIPTTMFRFFTVYGPWGRPDMALFKFTKAILEEKPIDVFNHGKHTRDFTYIDDIVGGVLKTLDQPASINFDWNGNQPDPATSNAPWRIYNIGNSKPVQLMDYINALEKSLGKKAKINFLPLQPGDVADTYADVNNLQKKFNYKPSTTIVDGVSNFIEWYKSYYKV